MDITSVLIKILAWRFYRENSGFLLFSYVCVISYCFFIKTAGVYQTNESVFYHLMLMMTFIVSPMMMLMVFVLFLLYTVKSWKYVIKQLEYENNQFLFYSFNASSRSKQFMSFFCVQLVISLPLIGYWLFATILGVIFKANLIPLVTSIYILVLVTCSAILYRRRLNRVKAPAGRSLLSKVSKDWNKPYSTLFLYYLSRKLKVSFIITKICSWLMVTGIYHGFTENITNQRIPEMVILGVVITHSFLIYKDHYFKETFVGFSRNMPYKPLSVLLNFGLVFLVIISPELLWLFTTINLTIAIKSLMIGLTTAFLFRSLIYLTGLQTYKYLIWVFCLFVVQFYTLMFDQIALLLVVNTVIALAIFHTRYYKPRHIIS